MKPGLISPGTQACGIAVTDASIFCEIYLSIPGGCALCLVVA